MSEGMNVLPHRIFLCQFKDNDFLETFYFTNLYKKSNLEPHSDFQRVAFLALTTAYPKNWFYANS